MLEKVLLCMKASHLLHSEGPSPVQATRWAMSRVRGVKALTHSSPWWGFSQWWSLWYLLRWEEWWQVFPHSHIHSVCTLIGFSDEPLAEGFVWRSYYTHYTPRGSFQYGSSDGQPDAGSDWNSAAFTALPTWCVSLQTSSLFSRPGGQTNMFCRWEHHPPHPPCSLLYAQAQLTRANGTKRRLYLGHFPASGKVPMAAGCCREGVWSQPQHYGWWLLNWWCPRHGLLTWTLTATIH